MQRYEYRVIPAPARGDRVRGAKTPEDRLAHTLTDLMNAQSREGWEYLHAETLPSEVRSGFGRRSTTYVNLLVFRRTAESDTADTQPPGSVHRAVPGLSRTGSPSGVADDPAGAPRLGPATTRTSGTS